MFKSNKETSTSVASSLKRTVSSVALAAVMALGTGAALQAQAPAPADTPGQGRGSAGSGARHRARRCSRRAPRRHGGLQARSTGGAAWHRARRRAGCTPRRHGGRCHPWGPIIRPSRPTPPSPPSDNAAVKFSPADILSSPDWPCIQRKVPTISPAQVWDGPPIDGIKEFEPGHPRPDGGAREPPRLSRGCREGDQGVRRQGAGGRARQEADRAVRQRAQRDQHRPCSS